MLSAKNICKSIIDVLNKSSNTTDYQKEISIFALQAPDWKILADEKHRMEEIIRQVCTGEMPISEANSKFSNVFLELDQLDTWLQVPSK